MILREDNRTSSKNMVRMTYKFDPGRIKSRIFLPRGTVEKIRPFDRGMVRYSLFYEQSSIVEMTKCMDLTMGIQRSQDDGIKANFSLKRSLRTP
jgi:hypothetical protein